MKCVQFLCCLSIFDLHVALQQRHNDVRSSLNQMDRLDEALHDVHYKLAVGSDQLPRGREYGRRTEGIYGKGIPPVAKLPTEAQIDWQRASVNHSRSQGGNVS